MWIRLTNGGYMRNRTRSMGNYVSLEGLYRLMDYFSRPGYVVNTFAGATTVPPISVEKYTDETMTTLVYTKATTLVAPGNVVPELEVEQWWYEGSVWRQVTSTYTYNGVPVAGDYPATVTIIEDVSPLTYDE